MKANVPKKIYIACDLVTEDGRAFILEQPVSCLRSVEYVHTDAFIEKACSWLKENKDKYLYNTGEKGEYIPTCSGKIVDEFRKYMEE